MNFQKSGLKEYGFSGFVTISHLKSKGCGEIPKEQGVYIVARDDSQPVIYLGKSIGGHFKGKDPTVSTSKLISKWVDRAYVLYIGRTTRTLDSRIDELIEFGKGRDEGHWGGRYIWQLKNADGLVVAWKCLPDIDPQTEKTKLIREFENQYSKRPFANLRE